MKRMITGIIICLLISVSPAMACFLQPAGPTGLYQVFNQFFYAENDSARMGSDISLLNSTHFLPNGQDTAWAEQGDILRVDVTYRQSPLWQELGYTDGSNHHTLIAHEAIPNRQFTKQGVTFSVPETFMWTDTIGLSDSGPLQRWYADPALNPLGAKDHFLAFAIDDDVLLSVFNSQYGTQYATGSDQVWMIAFEAFNLGSADYTDLVAVIARPADLNANPVPLPGAALLLASALGAMAFRRGNKHPDSAISSKNHPPLINA